MNEQQAADALFGDGGRDRGGRGGRGRDDDDRPEKPACGCKGGPSKGGKGKGAQSSDGPMEMFENLGMVPKVAIGGAVLYGAYRLIR